MDSWIAAKLPDSPRGVFASTGRPFRRAATSRGVRLMPAREAPNTRASSGAHRYEFTIFRPIVVLCMRCNGTLRPSTGGDAVVSSKTARSLISRQAVSLRRRRSFWHRRSLSAGQTSLFTGEPLRARGNVAGRSPTWSRRGACPNGGAKLARTIAALPRSQVRPTKQHESSAAP